MDLLLIRHAEPVRIVDAAGPADPPLRDRGHLQAERLAKWLADERLDAIVSSPMVRARETAAPVAAAHGLDVIIDDDLAEFDRDANSYIPYEEMKASKDPRFLAMVEGNLEDFETDPLEFQAAVVAAIERVIEANPSRTVAVVCHGGVINAYTAHVAGISKVMWFETQYASISRVVASSRPGGPRSIVTLNETPHLRGTGLLPS
jgi:2,3-bisphosphoglycerate-dependent phosphoglycerate mutase